MSAWLASQYRLRSDGFKARSFEAKAKAKARAFEAKAKAKARAFETKARAFEAKARIRGQSTFLRNGVLVVYLKSIMSC